MKGRPRVMHVVAKLHLGGSEVVALSLAEALRHQMDFSFFSVLGVEDDEVGRSLRERLDRAEIPLFTGTPLDMKLGGMLHGGWRLRQVLRRVRPDVVHLHTDVPDATYAASTLFAFGDAPEAVVRTVHNTTLWPVWRRVGVFSEWRLERAWTVGVNAASLAALHDFRSRHGLPRLPDAQCEVIVNGVAAPPLTRTQRRPGPTRVLFAGRLEPQKGTDLLPRIIERARQLTSADAEVTIAGTGSQEPLLRSWLEGAAPGGWPVSLTPPIVGLSERLADYDVLLMPSRHEGLALTCIEAVLAGVPVLVADIDGLRDVFPMGAPLSAPSGDVEAFARRLAGVVEDPARYRAAALDLVESARTRFGVDRMARDYLGVYRSLLAPAPVEVIA
ncbi:glycosyltransferase family 4 protein [Deinococcus pimensis]|uniref:glycosyltransferase family 4 protein n=1 Tax=Deinococcus pimensis TaxID=309888 RepID=UPI000487E5E7|nr:glycosyltransferase family 4 protein [Deinococcus pimensis]